MVWTAGIFNWFDCLNDLSVGCLPKNRRSYQQTIPNSIDFSFWREKKVKIKSFCVKLAHNCYCFHHDKWFQIWSLIFYWLHQIWVFQIYFSSKSTYSFQNPTLIFKSNERWDCLNNSVIFLRELGWFPFLQ